MEEEEKEEKEKKEKVTHKKKEKNEMRGRSSWYSAKDAVIMCTCLSTLI